LWSILKADIVISAAIHFVTLFVSCLLIYLNFSETYTLIPMFSYTVVTSQTSNIELGSAVNVRVKLSKCLGDKCQFPLK